MATFVDRERLAAIKRRFHRLYGDASERCVERLSMMIGAYGVGLNPIPVKEMWNERDVVLITYGDSLKKEGEDPLSTLHQFCNRRLKGAIKVIHLLPFYPWSSDDGFFGDGLPGSRSGAGRVE